MKTDLTYLRAKLQAALTLAACWLTRFLGGADILLKTLLVFMAADIATGLIAAFHEKKLSSAIGFKGISKKALILLLVGLAHMMDESIGGGALRGAVLGFYISNEGLSVLENAARLGLPVPQKLKGALIQLHGKEDGDG